MAFPSLATFYLGLVLIVIGTGLLKPNVSVIVGQLYARSDTRRDAGFSIFYMGINLGAFIAPLICGYLGQRVNWHLGFAAAGVGMVLGVDAVHARRASTSATPACEPVPAASPAAARGSCGAACSSSAASSPPRSPSSASTAYTRRHLGRRQVADGAGYLLLIITVVFFAWLFLSAAGRRTSASGSMSSALFFLAAALFWSVFEQAGSTLNLFADRDTRTSVFGWSFPSSWFQSVNSLFILMLAPVFAWLWIAARLARAVDPGQVRVRPALVGAGLRRAGRWLRSSPQAASRSARCG